MTVTLLLGDKNKGWREDCWWFSDCTLANFKLAMGSKGSCSLPVKLCTIRCSETYICHSPVIQASGRQVQGGLGSIPTKGKISTLTLYIRSARKSIYTHWDGAVLPRGDTWPWLMSNRTTACWWIGCQMLRFLVSPAGEVSQKAPSTRPCSHAKKTIKKVKCCAILYIKYSFKKPPG